MARLLIVSVLSFAMVAATEPCGDDPTEYPFANWMAQVQEKSMLELVLAGSHDAGCIRDKNSDWAKRTAVTQDLTLTKQMCKGVTVYDLRFAWAPWDLTRGTATGKSYMASRLIRGDRRKGGYYIHHGSSTPLPKSSTHFYFQSMESVAKEISNFCNRYDKQLLVFRVKIEERTFGKLNRKLSRSSETSTNVKLKEKVLKEFISQINSGEKNCVVSRGPTEVSCVGSPLCALFIFFSKAT